MAHRQKAKRLHVRPARSRRAGRIGGDLYVGKILEKAPYINMVGMRNALADLAKTVPPAKDAKPEQFIDMQFLNRLEQSGLLKELYR